MIIRLNYWRLVGGCMSLCIFTALFYCSIHPEQSKTLFKSVIYSSIRYQPYTALSLSTCRECFRSSSNPGVPGKCVCGGYFTQVCAGPAFRGPTGPETAAAGG